MAQDARNGLTGTPTPREFFGRLVWLDGTPLLDHIEPYRMRLFDEALAAFDGPRPRFNLVLSGRGKKNWKSADLILAALYRFLVWPSVLGNDCLLLANDAEQAGNDLQIAKRLVECNPSLAADVDVQAGRLVRTDGRGALEVLPAGDVHGAHGRTYLFIGFDEIHAYESWDLLEALAPDPTRTDALTWITSYASIYNSPGAPLYDLIQIGKAGDDPRMLFSWYSSSYCTDPDFEAADAEQRANPSMASWPEGREYLVQQRRRLPAHKYRRLHLNEPGLPDGAALPADLVMAAVDEGRCYSLDPKPGVRYYAFVDMSGGSSDDATLAIGHVHHVKGVIVDLVRNQGQSPPFDPRKAVKSFAKTLRKYGIKRVQGDAYGGQTFRQDFQAEGILYEVSKWSKHELYENLEVALTTGKVQFPDIPVLREQLLGLVWRGQKIDHAPNGHDDWANAVAGVAQVVDVGCWEATPDQFHVEEGSVGAQLAELARQGVGSTDAFQRINGRITPWSDLDQPDYSGALGPYIV